MIRFVLVGVLSSFLLLLHISAPPCEALERRDAEAYTGWWYDPAEPGTGVSLEIQGDAGFLGWYVYTMDGAPEWYVAWAEKTAPGTWEGDLRRYTSCGNSTLNYSDQGDIQVVFDGPDRAVIEYSLKKGGITGTKTMQRYLDSLDEGPVRGEDMNGWYTDDAASGTGFFVETKGRTLFLTWYAYTETGDPSWSVLGEAGNFPDGADSVNGMLLEFRDGTVLGGAYTPAGSTALGPAEISFPGAGGAIFSYDGQVHTLSRYAVDPLRLRAVEEYSLLELTGDPLEHNVLKLFSSAADAGRGRVYVAGIKSGFTAVYDTALQKFIGTLDTRAPWDSGEGELGIKYAHALPNAGTMGSVILRSTESSKLLRLDVEFGGLLAETTLETLTGDVIPDNGRNRLYLTRKQSPSLLIYDAVSLSLIGTSTAMDGITGKTVFAEDQDRLYTVNNAAAGGMGELAVWNPQTDALEASITFPRPADGVSDLTRDPGTDRFFLRSGNTLLVLDASGTELKRCEIPDDLKPERMLYDPKNDSVCILALEHAKNGRAAGKGSRFLVFPTQGESTTATHDYPVGYKTHRFTPADDGIYATEGDASYLWRIPNSPYAEPQPIRLGHSVDMAAVLPRSGRVVGTSRLGGSYLFTIDPETGSFDTFQTGFWPIPIRAGIYDDNEFLLVLNAWDSTISPVSFAADGTPEVHTAVGIGLPEGSTDRLPDMAVDWLRGLAFAAYPEFGKVAVVDWKNRTAAYVVPITDFSAGDIGGGPGQMQTAVNEQENILFVFDQQHKTLHLFDGNDGYTPLQTVDLAALDWQRLEDAGNSDWLFMDAQVGRLFIGPFAVDAVTGEFLGTALEYGHQVFGLDAANAGYWVREGLNDGETERFLVFSRSDLSLLHAQELEIGEGTPPLFCLDAQHRKIYGAYLNSAWVLEFEYGG